MGEATLHLSGKLVFTVLQDHVQIIAEENYILVNFKEHAALERVIDQVAPSSSSSKGMSLIKSLEKAHDLNRLILALNLIIDVRVNNKTYAEFGVSNNPKISANAVVGKIGSWFTKG